MARKLKEYPTVTLKLESSDDKIDFEQIFGRPGAVHIEIGIGRGTFLVNQAKAKPDDNFLGIEWANKYSRYAIDRVGRWELKNVRIIRTEASTFIADCVPDASVSCYHIYFPDPWPKKKHHKRRFLRPANLQQLVRTLKTNGQIRIATDHTEYFEEIKKITATQNGILEEIEFAPAAGAENGEKTGTNYERKFLKRKMPIYTLALQKKLAIVIYRFEPAGFPSILSESSKTGKALVSIFGS